MMSGVLLEVAKHMPRLKMSLPRGEGYLLDQLKRAVASAVLNLSEGNGRRSLRERRRFFEIALASVAESSSAIELLQAFGDADPKLAETMQANLTRAYAMLIKLKQSTTCFSS